MMIQFGIPSIASGSLIAGAVAVVILAVCSFLQPRGYRRSFFVPFLFRVLLLVLLGLILAAPYGEKPAFTGHLPALIDVSDSIDSVQGDKMLQLLRAVERPELPITLYPFGRKVSSVPFSLSDFSSYDQLRSAFSGLDTSASGLSEAIDSLVGSQGGMQLLVASDGYETRGSVRERLPLLRDKRVRVYPIIPEGNQKNQGAFRISQVYAPLTAAQLTTSTVRVTVENSTLQDRTGDLEIFAGNTPLSRQVVKVATGAEQVYVAQTLPAKGGIERVWARLIPRDKQSAESSGETFIAGEGRERVLLMSGSSQDSTYLAKVLENQAYQLDNRVGSGSFPSDSLSGYSTIILNNIAIDQLGRNNADAVVQAARAGKGVIMVGGDRSLGLGGYRGTVIEEALPVELLPPQREERRLSVAVMLVIDKSRSMDSDSKMDYAKEAARTFIANMKNDDYIGVIAFDASPFIVVRLGLLSEIRSMATDRIGRIFPTGSTRPLSAIDEARRSLVRVNAGRKHMLFLTDGQIEDAGPQYTELVRQMRLLGITSSTVMLGSEDGRFLKTLAEQGGGAYYQTRDARSLPRIFLEDVRVASGNQSMREQSSYRVLPAPDGKLRSTEITSYPQLLGYVQTKVKPKASTELIVSDGAKQEPLLARWQYGQGQVIAFASDANGRWSRDWISWGGYHQFWNELLGSVRPEGDSGAEKIPFDMRHFVENSRLVIEYALYSDDLAGTFTAQVKSPDGTSQELSFQQMSPGRYRAEITDPVPGRYDIAGSLGRRKTAAVAFSLPPDGFKEQQGLGYNMPLLNLMARTTGSVVNPTAGSLMYGMSKNMTRENRSGLFIIGAIICALLEILSRELLLRRRGVRAATAIVLLALLLTSRPAAASPRSDFYITQALERYFQLPVDAKNLSTAGAAGLLCRGSVCNYLNPAGLGFTEKYEIGATLADRSIGGNDFINAERIEQSEGRGYLAAAIPLGDSVDNAPRYGTFGIGYSRYHGDTDDQISTTPDGHRRTFAYGLSPVKNLALGYSFTFYDDQLKSDLADLHSHARFLHLFGLQADLGEGYELGAQLHLGIGQSDTEDFRFKSDGLSRPKQYTSSVALKKNWERFNLAFAGDYTDLRSRGNLDQVSAPVVIGGTENGYLFNLRSGAEAEVFEDFFARLGYRYFSGHYGFDRENLRELSGRLRGSGFSTGIGYAFHFCEQTVRADYGVEYLNVARKDWQHMLTLAWQF